MLLYTHSAVDRCLEEKGEKVFKQFRYYRFESSSELLEENSSKMGVLLQPSSAGTCMNKHPSAQHGPPEGTYIRVFSELIWTR